LTSRESGAESRENKFHRLRTQDSGFTIENKVMAEKFVVKAEKREGRGKNDSRRLRVEGKIPVSVYGGGEASLAAAAGLKELAAILRTDAGVNSVFSLDVEGVGVSDVIFQDRQIDSVKGRLIHADLRRIGKGEKMEMTVPLHFVGHAPGLDEEGAVINQPLHEIKVLCEPANVPDAIEVDVSNLNAGESIHVSDLKVAKGIEIQASPETVLATIVVVREELEPQVAESGEPEVVGKESETEK
jgi:large subunit ribosomal protein L25